MVYASVNMEQPRVTNRDKERPYFRGITAFNLHHSNSNFPLPDVGDYYEYRIHLGPKVSFAQPSISRLSDGEWGDSTNNILLPCNPSNVGYNDQISNSQV